MLPCDNAVAANVRDGMIGNAPPIVPPAVSTGVSAIGIGNRYRTRSSYRFSTDALSPDASANVSPIAACTTVPDGSGVGDWTRTMPRTRPPEEGNADGIPRPEPT